VSGLTWVAVAVLGGVGAVARFGVDAVVGARAGAGALPVGTLAVNVTGAFALGALSGAGVGGDALLLAGTATLGSYTTFSTWMLETHRAAEDGDTGAAALNVGLSLALGLAAAAAGRALA
jgi:fluoride exporter